MRAEKREVYYYSPLLSRREYQKWSTCSLIRRVYRGSARDLVASLVKESALSPEDLADLRAVLYPEEPLIWPFQTEETVDKAGFDLEYGNYVVLDHGNRSTAYCHLQHSRVTAGDYVAAGEAIGTVGSTGMSTGPHLHFAVSLDGVFCDPLEVLPVLDVEF